MNCVCPEPGWCETLRRFMEPRQHAICRGDVLTPAACAAYRANWERLKTASPPRSSCRHLGPELRRQDCPTCAGRVELKIFACTLHDECTLGKKLEGLACCSGCPDYEPATVSPESATGSEKRNP